MSLQTTWNLQSFNETFKKNNTGALIKKKTKKKQNEAMVLSRYVYINIHIITQWGDSSIQFLKCFVWISLSASKPSDKQSQTQQTV